MSDFERGGNVIYNDRADTIFHDVHEDIHLPDDIEVTSELVTKLVDIGKSNLPRYEMLQDYYEGWAVIQQRTKPAHKSNNKLISGYPSYIVDVIQGYFVGKPVEYSASEDETDTMDKIQEVFKLNDEQDDNSEIAKICGIKGRAYELVYQDSEGRTRFNQLEPDNVVYVYDNQINPEPLLAVRWFDEYDIFSGSYTLVAYVYTREREMLFREGGNGLVLEYDIPHTFPGVPVIEFKNNDEGLGDFERVLPLIDAYNKAQSDTANDFEEFTDAILILHEMTATKPEDIIQLRDEGVILTGQGQSAGWLIKNMNDVAIENYKDRLDDDIHKFSKVPNMSDENFSGNVSGESMKYKLLALDQLIVTKQRKFKRALQRRLELITHILSIKDTEFKYTDIEIKFTANKPVNEKDIVELATNLKGVVSDVTMLTKLTQVTGVPANEEQQRLEEEIDPYELGGDLYEDVEGIREDNQGQPQEVGDED